MFEQIVAGTIASEEEFDAACQPIEEQMEADKAWVESTLGVDDITSRLEAYGPWVARQQRLTDRTHELAAAVGGGGEDEGEGEEP